MQQTYYIHINFRKWKDTDLALTHIIVQTVHYKPPARHRQFDGVNKPTYRLTSADIQTKINSSAERNNARSVEL